jgi:Type II CAAX prenyl endopeptidase Rce1-like
MLGRQTNPVVAAFVSLSLTIGAAFSEEIFFRGFCYQILQVATNSPIIALIGSSTLFGLAHYPVNTANALLEAILGVCFGLSYQISGNNILVPIVMHIVYDFLTIFIAWLWCIDKLKNMAESEEKQLRNMSSFSADDFDEIVTSAFNTLDMDKDGFIDQNELQTGLRLMRIDSIPIWKTLPNALDQLKATLSGRRICYERFKEILAEGREDLNDLMK